MVSREKTRLLDTESDCGCLFPGLFLIFISDSATREIHQSFFYLQVETHRHAVELIDD